MPFKFRLLKATLLLPAIQLLCQAAVAQPRNKEELLVLDSQYQPTNDRMEAKYLVSVRKFGDSAFQYDTYHFVGPLIRSETFADHEGRTLHGVACYYNSIGDLDSVAQFKNGRKDGLCYRVAWKADSLELRTIYLFHQDSLVSINENEAAERAPADEGVATATYPGGEKKWKNYLFKSLQYTARGVDENINGLVRALFTIDEFGQVKDISIGRSVEYSLDREVLRVLRLSQNWIPATRNGQAVKSRLVQSVDLRLREPVLHIFYWN